MGIMINVAQASIFPRVSRIFIRGRGGIGIRARLWLAIDCAKLHQVSEMTFEADVYYHHDLIKTHATHCKPS